MKSLRNRYTIFRGNLVGKDQDGNKYYKSNISHGVKKERRWVLYKKEISESKIKLKNIQEDIQENEKINEELEQRKKELEILKKRLGEMKKTDVKNLCGDDSKSVVEAASQIVATTNKRLQDTMKELDVIRQLLDKERKAHAETKKKL